MSSLTEKPEWKSLKSHKDTLPPLKEMSNRYTIDNKGLHLDYSKNTATKETIGLLVDLAKSCQLEEWRDKMFSGEKINNTQDRAVLHTALRSPNTAEVNVDGENIIPFVHKTLERMKEISDRIREDKKITDVVNVGVGGSDLGPHTVCGALRSIANGPNMHFISNLDGTHANETLDKIKPENTVFLISSKSFSTQETMTNAQTIRKWFLQTMPEEEIDKHFIALSSHKNRVADFGISEDNMISFRNWVGGRFSLWSPIGLSICISVGFENFKELLSGAHEMDNHFKTAPLDKNIPALMGLLGVWYRNFWGAESYTVLPYAENLHRLTTFLQQVDMESNGKSVDRDGEEVDYQTGPVLFGKAGTNGQHAFYQLIHQGTSLIPCDFILVKDLPNTNDEHQTKLLANGLAQSDALMYGQTLEQANGDPHHVFNGNIPSNTIVLDKLTPFTLGQLIALYEHKIFVQGIIWNLNSFDQPGVDLGKELANNILANGASSPLHKFVLETKV